MERESWDLSNNVYSLGAEVYPLDPAVLYSPQQGAPASRTQEDQLKIQEIQPQTQQLALGYPRPLGQAQRAEATTLARLCRGRQGWIRSLAVELSDRGRRNSMTPCAEGHEDGRGGRQF